MIGQDERYLKSRWMEYWNHENHDRPLISVEVPLPEKCPAPEMPRDLRERWEDPGYVVAAGRWRMEHTWYGGEAMPTLNPDLGPNLLGAMGGCEITYGEATSWAEPMVEDWESYPPIAFDERNPWWKKICALTQAAVDDARGDYLVGITDLHPGLDGLAALRGSEELCYDVIECPELLLPRIQEMFALHRRVYDGLDAIISPHQSGSTNWMGIWHPEKRWYVISNDFSCMIKGEDFDALAAPGIALEQSFLDAAMYHLDGPDAVRHVDKLIQYPGINGIQWVYGAGQPTARYWIDLLRKIQNAGKLIQVNCEMEDVLPLCRALRPEGVHLIVHDCPDVETGKRLLRSAEEATRENSRN